MNVPRKLRTATMTGVAVIAALALSAGQSAAGERCIEVRGSYVEHPASGPDCVSPVGLCIAGTYRGDIDASFAGTASSIVTTADTPATTVSLFTSDSTITGRFKQWRGTLIVKNAGSFAAGGDGSIVDLQTIVGGTGQLSGATGSIRASGTFTFPDGGRSQYLGTVCRG
ncbi:hypothetical protein [Nakamurella sp.]|uniref:hypothetical protein n=1 Tax=Nakamurella sp. TaxID=1869182 RepID=UPI0037842188